MGMPPTEKSLRCQMAAFFIFDSADLVCEQVYFDFVTIMRQLTS